MIENQEAFDYIVARLSNLEQYVNQLMDNQPIKMPKEENPEIAVSIMLRNLGVPAHLKGYQYLRDSIIQLIEDVNFLGGFTTKLYPSIAGKYKTTSSRVERAIRHAIELAWDRGNIDMTTKFFAAHTNKSTNAEFIATIADRIKHPSAC